MKGKSEMWKFKGFLVVCLILSCFGVADAADVILNEYNAVASDSFLNGGDASSDADGGRASDSYFGRIKGNGLAVKIVGLFFVQISYITGIFAPY